VAIRLSVFDVFWAALSPWLALWIRGAQVLTQDPAAAAFYCTICFLCSLIAFLLFRIREGMTHLFSVHDALKVGQAVLASEFASVLLLFSLTRLEGIPRSTPIIHALILSAGLIIVRAAARMTHGERTVSETTAEVGAEHIIMIGANKLSSLYIDLLRAFAPRRYRVIAVLDDRDGMVGRSIAGVRVLAPSNHLCPVMQEFKEHGIGLDRVIVGGDRDLLSEEALTEIEEICDRQKIKLDFVPQLIGLTTLQEAVVVSQPQSPNSAHAPIPRYFSFKRLIDFCLSLLLIIVLLPVFLFVAVLVLFDVGSPVFYWQRRIGINGQAFQIHKFRTMKPAYDLRGRPVGTTERISWAGAFIRKFRLDELPQLLNVLVGDMSLIGPRPLLPHDQPPDPSLRLMVRPGITGWAQVNGGQLLSVEGKNLRDEWYIRHASPGLDLKIIGKTVSFLLAGERSHATNAESADGQENQHRAA